MNPIDEEYWTNGWMSQGKREEPASPDFLRTVFLDKSRDISSEVREFLSKALSKVLATNGAFMTVHVGTNGEVELYVSADSDISKGECKHE